MNNKKLKKIYYEEFFPNKRSKKLIIINPGIANNLNKNSNETKAYYYWANKLNEIGFNVLITVPLVHFEAWKGEANKKLSKSLIDIYDRYTSEYKKLLSGREEKEIVFIGYSIGTFLNGYIISKIKDKSTFKGLINISPTAMFNYGDWMFSENTWYRKMLDLNLKDKEIEKLKEKSYKNKNVKIQYLNSVKTLNLIPDHDVQDKNFKIVGKSIFLKNRDHLLREKGVNFDMEEHLNYWHCIYDNYIYEFIKELDLIK